MIKNCPLLVRIPSLRAHRGPAKEPLIMRLPWLVDIMLLKGTVRATSVVRLHKVTITSCALFICSGASSGPRAVMHAPSPHDHIRQNITSLIAILAQTNIRIPSKVLIIVFRALVCQRIIHAFRSVPRGTSTLGGGSYPALTASSAVAIEFIVLVRTVL